MVWSALTVGARGPRKGESSTTRAKLAPSGVEEVDVSDQLIEYAVYGAPGELPSLPDLEANMMVEGRGRVSPDSWRLYFAVLVDGDPVGMQDLTGKNFTRFGTVTSFSWLAPGRRGEGLAVACHLRRESSCSRARG